MSDRIYQTCYINSDKPRFDVCEMKREGGGYVVARVLATVFEGSMHALLLDAATDALQREGWGWLNPVNGGAFLAALDVLSASQSPDLPQGHTGVAATGDPGV